MYFSGAAFSNLVVHFPTSFETGKKGIYPVPQYLDIEHREWKALILFNHDPNESFP